MNLMEGLLQQIDRLQNTVMPAYESPEIGQSGAIALHLMKASVALAKKAYHPSQLIDSYSVSFKE